MRAAAAARFNRSPGCRRSARERPFTRTPPRSARLFVHNFGEMKFARSTLLRRINAGEGARACSELSRWIYGKDNASHGRKRIQPGLVKRRKIERQLCEMQT